MIALYLLTLALLVRSSATSGGLQPIQEQWVTAADDDDDDDGGGGGGGVAFEYNDQMTQAVDMWPESSTNVGEFGLEGLDMSPSPGVKRMNGQVVASEEVKEKVAVWKIALVVAVLLVSLVGSLSLAYYLCIWRGGRIYYQAQREGFP